MAIVLQLKNEAEKEYHINILTESRFDEDVEWPPIAKAFFAQLQALGYRFSSESVLENMEELIEALVAEGVCD